MSPDTMSTLLTLSVIFNALLLWYAIDAKISRDSDVDWQRQGRVAAERRAAKEAEKAAWIKASHKHIAATAVEDALAKSRERAFRVRDN
jgi:hypothetical protein